MNVKTAAGNTPVNEQSAKARAALTPNQPEYIQQ